jgi:hypothetical protein
MKTTAETFHYRLNGGAERQIEANTGIYQFAALAIPAVTGETKLPMVIEIWCPRLLPEYGPVWYEIADNEFGCPVLRLLVRNTA